MTRGMRLGPIVSVCASLATFYATSADAKDYKSAEYISRTTYGFGAFEARIRAPEGPGVIGTFFLWRPGSETPQVPWEEIDFEFGPAGGDYQTQIMTPGPEDQGGRTEHQAYFTLPTGVDDAFYTYRMEWTPQYIAFYVNGTRVRYETNQTEYAALFNVDGSGDTPSGERMEVRLGLWPALSNIYGWAGRFDGSTVPTAQYVDYIKIWDYSPNASNPFERLLLSDDFDSLRWDRWYAANWTFEFSASDYVSNNIATRDGLLILGLTDAATQGQVPDLPPDVPPTPITFGSIVEAEDYEVFYERTPNRQGDHECTNTSVDAQKTSDPIGGRCNVGWTQSGEWLEYYVDVVDPGYYDLNLRASSGSAAMGLHVEVDGVDVAGRIPAPGLGWHNWAYMTAPRVYLSEGVHVVRVVFDTGEINFNFISFDVAADPDPTTSDSLDAGVSSGASGEITTDPSFYDASVPDPTDETTGSDDTSSLDASITEPYTSDSTYFSETTSETWSADASSTETFTWDPLDPTTGVTSDVETDVFTSVEGSTATDAMDSSSSEAWVTDVTTEAWSTAPGVTSDSSSSTAEVTSDPIEEPVPTAQATVHVFTDWRSGYCAELKVQSPTGAAGWEVDVTTPGASLYTSWNTTLSGTAPAYTFGPVSWNAAIPVGGTRVVGFCANRQSMNALPIVTAVRAE